MSIAAGSRTIRSSKRAPAVFTTAPCPPTTVASPGPMYVVVTPPDSSSRTRISPASPDPKVPNGANASMIRSSGVSGVGTSFMSSPAIP